MSYKIGFLIDKTNDWIKKILKEENFNLLRIGNNELFPSFFYYKSKKYIIKIFKKN